MTATWRSVKRHDDRITSSSNGLLSPRPFTKKPYETPFFRDVTISPCCGDSFPQVSTLSLVDNSSSGQNLSTHSGKEGVSLPRDDLPDSPCLPPATYSFYTMFPRLVWEAYQSRNLAESTACFESLRDHHRDVKRLLYWASQENNQGFDDPRHDLPRDVRGEFHHRHASPQVAYQSLDTPRPGDATRVSNVHVLTDEDIDVLMEGGVQRDLQQGYDMMSDEEREKLHYPFEDTMEQLNEFRSKVDRETGPRALARDVSITCDSAWVKMRSYLASETASRGLQDSWVGE